MCRGQSASPGWFTSLHTMKIIGGGQVMTHRKARFSYATLLLELSPMAEAGQILPAIVLYWISQQLKYSQHMQTGNLSQTKLQREQYPSGPDNQYHGSSGRAWQTFVKSAQPSVISPLKFIMTCPLNTSLLITIPSQHSIDEWNDKLLNHLGQGPIKLSNIMTSLFTLDTRQPLLIQSTQQNTRTLLQTHQILSSHVNALIGHCQWQCQC